MSGYAHRPKRVIRVGLTGTRRLPVSPVNGHSQDRRACLKSAAISGSGRNKLAAAGLLKYAAANVA